MMLRKILLLDLSQRDARRCVTRNDDQFRAAVEEFDDAFERVPVNDVERPRSVGSAGVIAQDR